MLLKMYFQFLIITIVLSLTSMQSSVSIH